MPQTRGIAVSISPESTRLLQRIALGALWTAAVLSTAVGVRNGLARSQDFQWSPARVLAHGGSPYESYLNRTGDILLAQTPNYLHLLYFIFIPLGLLSFTVAKAVWAASNVAMAIGAAVLVARYTGANRMEVSAFVALFLIAAPVRNTIGNGQQAILVLLCALLAYRIQQSATAGTFLAIALTKYSFAPVGLIALARGRVRAVVFAAAILIIAALGFAARTNTSLVDAVTLPFSVSRGATAPGTADIMTLVDHFIGAGSSLGYVLAAVGAIAAILCTYRSVRRGDWLHAIAIAALISLACFKHLPYDFCFLLPVAAVAWRSRGWERGTLAVIVFYFWYGSRAIAATGLGLSSPIAVAVSFGLLITALYTIALAHPGGTDGIDRARRVSSWCATRRL